VVVPLAEAEQGRAVDLSPGDAVRFACQDSVQLMGMVSALNCWVR